MIWVVVNLAVAIMMLAIGLHIPAIISLVAAAVCAGIELAGYAGRNL